MSSLDLRCLRADHSSCDKLDVLHLTLLVSVMSSGAGEDAIGLFAFCVDSSLFFFWKLALRRRRRKKVSASCLA